MKQSLEHIDFIISNSEKTIGHFDKSNPTDSQLLPIGMLQRLLHVSIALKRMIPEILKFKHQLCFSAALLVRPIILDILIVLDLIVEMAKLEDEAQNKAEIYNRIELDSSKILSDGLNSTMNYIEMAGNYKLKPEERALKNLNDFVNKYATYFEKDAVDKSIPKFKAKINALNIFKKLAGNETTIDLAKIYDSYIFYSKFEHFSIMYFDMVNLPLNIQLLQLKKSIEIFLSHNLNLHHILHDCTITDDFIKGQYTESSNYLMKFN